MLKDVKSIVNETKHKLHQYNDLNEVAFGVGTVDAARVPLHALMSFIESAFDEPTGIMVHKAMAEILIMAYTDVFSCNFSANEFLESNDQKDAVAYMMDEFMAPALHELNIFTQDFSTEDRYKIIFADVLTVIDTLLKEYLSNGYTVSNWYNNDIILVRDEQIESDKMVETRNSVDE